MNERNDQSSSWLAEQAIHPLREQLTHELHARPFESLNTPLDIFLFAKYTGEGVTHDECQHLANFCRAYKLPEPETESRHHRMHLEGELIRWERHGEFTTFSLFKEANTETPFAAEVSEALLQFMAQTEGEILVATHVSIREYDDYLHSVQAMQEYFQTESLVSANIASDEAQVWTDLQLHDSGYNRILLLDRNLVGLKMGRVAQRLMDVSTYRNMALLALPIAQSAASQIAALDKTLSQLLDQLNDSAQDNAIQSNPQNPIDVDTEMLTSLTDLSMKIQAISTQTQYRLSAADAYYALINSRIEELNETRVAGFQTIGEFLQRRLSPAMRTCHSVATRLDDLSSRTSRAVNLLRTRLDLTLEHQNHKLLGSMNKRVLVQMRLQETVEGLSIAAITYYFVGLVGYMAKSTKMVGLGISPELITGMSVIPIGLMVWYSIRKVKQRIMGMSESS